MARAWAVLASALLSAMVATPAFHGEETCNRPQVLTLGWPVEQLEPPREGPQVLEQVESRLRPLLSARFSCKSQQAPVVNLVFGSNYQLLDWLNSGSIDAAWTTALVAELARQDGADLVYLPAATRWERIAGRGALGQYFRLAAEREPSKLELRLPSFVSNEMLVVLADAARYAERRVPASERSSYWQNVFSHLCLRATGSCQAVAEAGPALPPRRAFSLATQQNVHGPLNPAAAQPGEEEALLPHLLVFQAKLAAALFKPAQDGASVTDFPALPNWWIPPELTDLLAAALPGKPLAGVGPLAALAHPEPRFGTRPFRFTALEALELIRDQRLVATAGQGDLGLVLPGGGVKAAYQTHWIDTLYGGGYLRNSGAIPPEHEKQEDGPLTVDLITGTSGGALIGYFVARLPTIPPQLTPSLWRSDAAGRQVLDHGDVFGSADMLRFLALSVSFCLFSLALALSALRSASPFSLESLAQKRRSLTPIGRPLLAWSATVLLLATPFAVRIANGSEAQEQVPEIEGVFYLVLVLLAMIADQCLLASRETSPVRRDLRTPAAVTLVVGAVLAAIPLRLTEDFGGKTPAWSAILLLALGLAAPLLAWRSRQGRWPGWRACLLGLAEFFTVVSVLLGSFLASTAVHGALASLEPMTVTLFLLAFLLFALVELLAPTEGRTPRNRRSVWFLYLLTLTVIVFSTLALAGPQLTEPTTAVGWEVLLAESRLGIALGGLVVCLGAIFLLAGLLLALAAWSARYRPVDFRLFGHSLALALLHGFSVFGLIALAAWVCGGEGIVDFELTLSFWAALSLFAFILGCALCFWGALAGGTVGRWLGSTLAFLASAHPHGRFRLRRHVRMVHFALFAWLWWNLVLAPGLYSNRKAEDYLHAAADRFDSKQGFTSRLLVPANALPSQNDPGGPRYHLFVTRPEECAHLPTTSATGGLWRAFEVDYSGTENPQQAPGPCTLLQLRTKRDEKHLENILMASGSPFPVFPAHRVEVRDGSEQRFEYLVDGGYSNNVPIEPAHRLGIDQVLVLESSNPLRRQSQPGESWLYRFSLGQLVRGFGRLPGFLYERAQLLDRRSSENVFVVTLAPSENEGDWPILTQFQASVVKRMESVAQADQGRRIGFVESWGQPRVQWSFEIERPKLPASNSQRGRPSPPT